MTLSFGYTSITIHPVSAPFFPGDRVRYLPPVAGMSAKVATGTLLAISGVSALVLWDALGWAGGAPVERLVREG